MSSSPSSRDAVALITLRDARERSIAQLSDAFAHDLLEMEEFERRLSIAHRTDSLTELQSLCTDLVPASEAVPAPLTQPVAPSPALAVRDRQRMLLLMGGTERTGRWTPARRLRIIAVMGGAELDFREAVMAPGVYDIHITAVMGGVTLIVPPQLAVEIEGSAILGGFAHTERAPQTPDPDRPVLRVHGLAVMGGVHVETRLLGDSRASLGESRRQQRLAARRQPRALPPRRDAESDR